jgi:hypothetical protein
MAYNPAPAHSCNFMPAGCEYQLAMRIAWAVPLSLDKCPLLWHEPVGYILDYSVKNECYTLQHCGIGQYCQM